MEIPIARPPWTGKGKKIESMCRKALFDFSLLEDANGVAVALSGGKDSLSLLFMLKAILGKGFPDLPLLAIHVQGEFSCGASVHANFLRGICKELEVPLLFRESTQKRETLSCYRCSRERRKLIFDAAKEEGFSTIAFGHHQDDSTQTLLLNLLHKGEFAANLPKVPMHDYGVTIIRPFIYVPEKEIVHFAKQHGFARITCQCPVGQNSKRGVAKRLLEQLEEEFPNARVNLAQAAHEYGSKKAMTK
ncbi:tRNA 2-thiocytidine biosynthesis TtcA family protein [Simkania sp.]|uniref:tRNA 2-thiocytidine biosynthesis TtcA family protein n=1 Tax=Simkania sp. TaxID=34094 RepID=UPI003B529F11